MNKCTAKCTCSFNAGASDKAAVPLVAYTFLVPYFKRFHPPGHSRKHFYYSYNSLISTPTFIGHSMENKGSRRCRRISDGIYASNPVSFVSARATFPNCASHDTSPTRYHVNRPSRVSHFLSWIISYDPQRVNQFPSRQKRLGPVVSEKRVTP